MANFLNNGQSTRGQGILRFPKHDGNVVQEPIKYQATPEMIAEIDARCRKKYRNEKPSKTLISTNPKYGNSFTPPEKRNKPPERPAEEVKRARFRYIECIAAGMNRTQALDLLSEELDITHHEFYKLLKQWGFRDRENENEAVAEFVRSIESM